MTIIIGILGGKGAGKSTLARYLGDSYGATQYAIADKLKRLVKKTFDLSDKQLWGSQASKEAVDPRYGITPRTMMERQGDALREEYGIHFQIQDLLYTIAHDAPEIAVISDVRYKDEADYIKLHGCKRYGTRTPLLWRIHRARGLRTWKSEHATEADWQQIPVDAELHPTAELSDLMRCADDAARMLDITPARWLMEIR